MRVFERHGFWLLTVMVLLAACTLDPPPDAPSDVHYIGGKTPTWQYCAVDREDGKVHCKIWIDHHLYRDEVFVPYDRGPTPAPEELKIVDDALNTHVWIYLENGRLLIPVSEYEWSKELLQGKWAHILNERGYVARP